MRSVQAYETFDKLLFRNRKEAQLYEKETFKKVNLFINDLWVNNVFAGIQCNIVNTFGIRIYPDADFPVFFGKGYPVDVAVYACAIYKIHEIKQLQWFQIFQPTWIEPDQVTVINSTDKQWIDRIYRVRKNIS